MMDSFIKSDSLYMNPAEAALFKRLRSRGEITFFGCDRCAVCGAEIPKPKRYCNKKCYDQYAKACESIALFLSSLGDY